MVVSRSSALKCRVRASSVHAATDEVAFYIRHTTAAGSCSVSVSVHQRCVSVYVNRSLEWRLPGCRVKSVLACLVACLLAFSLGFYGSLTWPVGISVCASVFVTHTAL